MQTSKKSDGAVRRANNVISDFRIVPELKLLECQNLNEYDRIYCISNFVALHLTKIVNKFPKYLMKIHNFYSLLVILVEKIRWASYILQSFAETITLKYS